MTVDRLAHAELFFFDLDGTLLRDDGSLSPRTVRAFGRLTASGRRAALATGRPVRQAAVIAAKLGHRGYSVCSNGAVVYAHETGEVVAAQVFEPDVVAQVRATLRGIDGSLRLAFETLTGLVAEPGFPARGDHGTLTTGEDPPGDCVQILVHRPQGTDEDFADSVGLALKGMAEVSSGTPGGPLELTVTGVDKGTAALALAEILGTPAAAVAAFGDMPNDLPLLAAVGHPVAMANAHPSVLARVEDRAPANEQDGVAAVLETITRATVLRTHVWEQHRLSFAVAAHPDRLAAVNALRDRHPELDLEVVFDPEPHGPPMAMRSARLAWRTTPRHASHRVVLQDDVTLCRGFHDAVRAVVDVAPHDAVSMFAEWGSRAAGALRQAALAGCDFTAVVNNYVPTQALVLPAGVARGFDAYVSLVEPATGEDDLAMARYLEMRGVRSRITVPNLVEHDSETSLVGNGFMGIRQSACFAAGGVLGKRWRDRVFEPGLVPYFCGRTERAWCVIVDGPRRRDWRTVPARQLLLSMGTGRPELAASIAAHSHRDVIRSLVQPQHLLEAWMMARLLGVALANQAQSDGVQPDQAYRRAADEPWAAAALSTMAAGALRGFTPWHAIPHAQDLLLDGVRHGFADRADELTGRTGGRRWG